MMQATDANGETHSTETVSAVIPASGKFTFKRWRQVMAIKITDKLEFTENLATLLASGIGITVALQILKEETNKKALQTIIDDIKERVKAGTSLSVCFASYDYIFSPMFVSMVRIGELSGNLSAVLNYLANGMRREEELHSRVKGALMYPALILAVMAAIGIGMVFFILPRIVGMFKDLNTKLPLPTKIMIAVSDYVRVYGLYTLVAAVVVVVALVILARSRKGKPFFDRVELRIPVIGTLVSNMIMSRMTRSLAALLKSGVPILETLETISKTAGNTAYETAMLDVVERVERGSALSEAFKQHPRRFPSFMVEMMRVSEETGMLDETLDKLSYHFERKVDYATRMLGELVEPLVMILMGVAVGVVAISVIYPMYDIMGRISA
jgi:type IV pilus assembly protein PilC